MAKYINKEKIFKIYKNIKGKQLEKYKKLNNLKEKANKRISIILDYLNEKEDMKDILFLNELRQKLDSIDILLLKRINFFLKGYYLLKIKKKKLNNYKKIEIKKNYIELKKELKRRKYLKNEFRKIIENRKKNKNIILHLISADFKINEIKNNIDKFKIPADKKDKIDNKLNKYKKLKLKKEANIAEIKDITQKLKKYINN